jgi:hypothetical protein
MMQPAARTSWLGTRPFWGGLLVTLAGAEMLVTVKAPLPVVLHVGMQGMIGYLLPLVLMACGLLLIFNPSQRLFYAIVSAVLTIASWLTSNLGGFILGIILGLLGSALAFAWSPDKPKASPRKSKASQGMHEASPGEHPASPDRGQISRDEYEAEVRGAPGEV